MWLSTNRAVFDDGIGDVDSIPYCDPVTGLYVWHSLVDSKYYISAIVGHKLTDGGSYTFLPVYFQSFNGKIYFYSNPAGTPYYIFSSGSSWAFSTLLDGGISEYYVNPTYYGDDFYTSNTLVGTYTGGGTNKNSAPVPTKTISRIDVVGWESTSLYGEYTPVSGSGMTGSKYVGWKQYLMDNGKGYFRQRNTKIDGKFIIQSETTSSDIIYYSSSLSAWAFGDIDPAVGYWKNTATDPVGTYNLVYTGLPPNPTPSSYSVSFDSYVSGVAAGTMMPELESIYLAEALRYL